MKINDPVTVNEACKILGTYDRLIIGFAARNGVKLQRKGRVRYIFRADIELLRPDIEAWYKRPRLRELNAAASA